MILVQKISSNPSTIKNKEKFKKGSLNSNNIKKREQLIDKENQVIYLFIVEIS